MGLQITSDYKTILENIEQVNPVKYGITRNYLNGDVTYLSPYISRGIISTKQVLENVLAKGYKISKIESFVKELCWRDYFQRIGQVKDLRQDIKQSQQPVTNYEIPLNISNANTGITVIDYAIEQLYNSGYMHNHCRMYTASLVCNIAKSQWLHPAQWMYYHLLDGDWASNACSWQWVVAANSSKKYFANQENINRYTNTNQANTFLNKTYVELKQMEVPPQLLITHKLVLETVLPPSDLLQLDNSFPTFIYNYYNLDSKWHKDETNSNRILLLEPDFYEAYPISKKCMEFMLALSKNIPNLQVYVGSFESLKNQIQQNTIFYKEHPLNIGYTGIEEPREWIVDSISGYYPSFFSYWKKVEKQLLLKYN